jgi:hypothetical protein
MGRIFISFILFAGCVPAAPQRQESRRDFQKTVTLGSGKTLRVEHALGNLTIRTHSGSELRVQARLRCSARSANEANDCLNRIQVNVDESASGVSVRTVYPRSDGGRNDLSFGGDVEIQMPATSPLDARNRFGSVSVDGLRAPAFINNANGRVSFTGGQGKQRIENSFGDTEVRTNDGDVTIVQGNGNVTVTDATGVVDIGNRFGTTRVTNAGRGLSIHGNNGNVEVYSIGGAATVSNTFGKVTVSEAKGDVNIDNGNGEVDASGITGRATIHNTFGPVHVTRVSKGVVVRSNNANVTGDTIGDSATVETTFGGVDLRSVKGPARVTAGNSGVRLAGVDGEIYVKTTFAGTTITDAAGPITVESQNGSVTAEARAGARCQPVSLQTSFGPIRVTLPSGEGYNLTAHTSFGRIHSQHEVQMSGDLSPQSITGRIGAGGCQLKLTGQNGDIEILKK